MAAMGGGCMKLVRVSVDMDVPDDGYHRGAGFGLFAWYGTVCLLKTA